MKAPDRQADPTTVDGLNPDPKNRRRHTPRKIDMIAEALRQVGASRYIVIDETNEVLAGNGVIEAAAMAGISKLQIIDAPGDTIVAVRRSGLSAEQKRSLAIFDNRTAELAIWNAELLAADLADGLDLATFFNEEELRGFFPAAPLDGRPTLAEQFGVPPFSVLDARQGYWQDRKRAWLSLGIESELGRGGGTWVESEETGSPVERREAIRKTRGAHEFSASATIKRQGGTIGWDGSKVMRARVSPGGSPRPAMKLKNGKTERGDGRGRPLPEEPKP
jgi:hypothetical protein